MKKRVLSIFMAVVMLLGILPVTAVAEDVQADTTVVVQQEPAAAEPQAEVQAPPAVEPETEVQESPAPESLTEQQEPSAEVPAAEATVPPVAQDAVVVTYTQDGVAKTESFATLNEAMTRADKLPSAVTDAVVTVTKDINEPETTLYPYKANKVVLNEGVTVTCKKVTMGFNNYNRVILENHGTLNIASMPYSSGTGLLDNSGTLNVGYVKTKTKGWINSGTINVGWNNEDFASKLYTMENTGTIKADHAGYQVTFLKPVTVNGETCTGSYKWDATNNKWAPDGAFAVTQNGTQIGVYGDYAAAAEYANEVKADGIRLLDNVTLHAPMEFNSKMTLDMNGKTLTMGARTNDTFGSLGDGHISAVAGADLTITGNGTFTYDKADTQYKLGILVDTWGNAEVTIENGTFHSALVCVEINDSATVNITGGSFLSDGPYDGRTWLLNKKDAAKETATFAVSGGTFKDFDPSNSATESPADNFLAPGYISVPKGDSYVVGTLDELAVAQVGTKKYVVLEEAIKAATPGDTVTLLKDITLDTPSILGDTRYNLFVTKNLTLDGAGHTITNGIDRGIGVQAENVTFKNMTILNKIKKGRGIDTRGSIGTFTLDGVKIQTTGFQSQPLTIGGSQESAARIVIKNSELFADSDGYAIIMFNPVDMEITDSTLQGWATLYFKGPSGSYGSSGSKAVVSRSTLNSENDNNGSSDNFAMIQFESDGPRNSNIDITLNDCKINVAAIGKAQQELIAFHSTDYSSTPPEDYVMSNNHLNITGANTKITFTSSGTGKAIMTDGYDNAKKSNNTISMTAGSINMDPTPYVEDTFAAVGNKAENPTEWTVQKLYPVIKGANTDNYTVTVGGKEVTHVAAGQVVTVTVKGNNLIPDKGITVTPTASVTPVTKDVSYSFVVPTLDQSLTLAVTTKPTAAGMILALQDFLDGNSGDTFQLTESLNLADTKLAVNATKPLTLDLNGFVLSGNAAADPMLTNNGDLTIVDTSGKNGKITYAGTGAGATVANNGKLTVKSGVLENAATGDVIVSGASDKSVELTVTGGIIRQTNATGAAVHQNAAANTANKMTISGGLFIGKTNAVKITTGESSFGDAISASVTGGTFDGTIAADESQKFISGGVFFADPADTMIVDHYNGIKNDATGTWEVLPVYDITETESKNFVTDASAPAGSVVQVVPTLPSGKIVDTVTVTYEGGKAVVTPKTDGTYSFLMPAAPVTVAVTFKPVPVSRVEMTLKAPAAEQTSLPASSANSFVKVTTSWDNALVTGAAFKFSTAYTVTLTVTEANKENLFIENPAFILNGQPVQATKQGNAYVVTYTFPKTGDKKAEPHNVTGTDAMFSSDSAVMGTMITVTPASKGSSSKVSTVTYTGAVSKKAIAITAIDGNYTFVMPDEDVEVAVTYKTANTITNAAGSDGDNSWSCRIGDQQVTGTEAYEGDLVTIVPKVAAGYKATITVTGATLLGNGTSFIMPASPVTVSVTFEDQAQAMIGSIKYLTLQDAVDMVQNGQSITLLEKGNGAVAEVKREVSFILDALNSYTATITADGTYTLSQEGNLYNVAMPKSETAIPTPAKSEVKAFQPDAAPMTAEETNVAKAAHQALTDELAKPEIMNDLVKSTSSDKNALAEAADAQSRNVNTEDAKKKGVDELKKQLGSTVTADDTKVVVQPFVEVQVKAAKKFTDTSGKPVVSVVVDLTPKMKTIVTTKDVSDNDIRTGTGGETQNAVQVAEEPMNVTHEVQISLPLPPALVAASQAKETDNTSNYVTHTTGAHSKWGGMAFIYTATIEDGSTLTFKNPHGFSDFEITVEDPSVARSDRTDYGYANLKDAVKDASSGSTITITKTPQTAEDLVVENKKVDFKNNTGADLNLTVNGKPLNIGNGSTSTVDTVVYQDNSSGHSSRPSYSIQASKTSHGTVVLNTTSATSGNSVTFTATPDKGYVVDEITVTDAKGKTVQVTSKGGDKYAFIMPAGKVQIEVTFKEVTELTFTDVNVNDYFYSPVVWAVKNGITGGKTAEIFSPHAACTRAQTVTFLWRAAGKPAPKSDVNPFTDLVKDAYYYDAVLWAVEQGITKGATATTFAPDATVNRSQTVTFLHRFAGSPAAETSTAFSDVVAGSYYENAVQWAVENGITLGKTDTSFAPTAPCSRAQIVTFLYRAEK